MVLWYPCCGIDTPPCPKCSADSDTVVFTPFAFGNGSCNCSSMNGVGYVLSRNPANSCQWTYTGTITCGGTTRVLRIEANVQWYSGDYRWIVYLYIDAAVYMFGWASGGTIPFDCTATRALNLYYHYDTGYYCTNALAVSGQIN